MAWVPHLALFAAISPWALAQVTVAPPLPSAAGRTSSAPITVVRSLPSGANGAVFRGFQRHTAPLFPFGLFPDSLFSGSASSSEPQAAVSALTWIEALAALNKAPEQPPPPPAQPLLIELQGDRYVRLTTADGSENPEDSREPARVLASRRARPGAAPQRSTASELPPAVLIFRDGHREEVRDYSIVSGVIYARGDYYTDGYWNKQIELTALNLPETLTSNQARGMRFILPTAPNEVVTRP